MSIAKPSAFKKVIQPNTIQIRAKVCSAANQFKITICHSALTHAPLNEGALPVLSQQSCAPVCVHPGLHPPGQAIHIGKHLASLLPAHWDTTAQRQCHEWDRQNSAKRVKARPLL